MISFRIINRGKTQKKCHALVKQKISRIALLARLVVQLIKLTHRLFNVVSVIVSYIRHLRF